ncbi:PKD domain-containing protein [Ferrimonas gelatinilytica]|uniref:Uncharacterized protein n=1 Tax=Ferrimonas gelatinilytica TaxID=1255257 RepID=A0ABP9S1N5_9GAMM
MRHYLTAALVLGLMGCGGSGGDSSSPLPSPGPALEIQAPATAAVGDAIALVARPVDTSSTDWRYRWRQTAGPAVNIANTISPVAAFDLPEAGSYQFEVSVTDGAVQRSETVDINVQGLGTGFTVTRDHAVVSGGRVSLRVTALEFDENFNLTAPTGILWQQTQGPSVSDMDSRNPLLMTFTAPRVTQDTLLTFEASGTLDGRTVSDEIQVLVRATPAPVEDAFFDTPVARVEAYRPDSPWASAMERCVYNNRISTPCTVESLPLIGQTTNTTTIDEVMDRVLVSHPWMGEQFERFLREQDPSGDFLHLLSSVTAVVLSYDVRPSFYWVATGAIYLDPEYLWLEDWQRNTINEDPDFRAGFGSMLAFFMPWRYVSGDEYASLYYPPQFHLNRPWQQLTPDLASLLYHELAHANDYFPRSTHSAIRAATLVEEYFTRVDNQGLPSDQLSQTLPLFSEQMSGLAEVRFRGATATDLQKSYTPDDVAGFFFPDRASDFYGYSSEREDLAMLFEEAMMWERYGIRRDVAVTGLRSDDRAQDLLVAQGQRGRIGQAELAPRLSLVLAELLPEAESIVDGLPGPVPMRSGESWWDNLVLSEEAVMERDLSPVKAFTGPQALPLEGRTHFGPRHASPVALPAR